MPLSEEQPSARYHQYAYDERTGVTANTIRRPGEPTTILAGPGEVERLDPSYARRTAPRKFFTFGKVFSALWTEPAGSTNTTDISYVIYGEQVRSGIRRFVVIQESYEAKDWCLAVQITTYGGRALAKPGVIPHEHALIYTGREPPPLQDSDVGILPYRIRVDKANPEDRELDPRSRLNFGKLYTIEHYVKVRPVGVVTNKDDLRAAWYSAGPRGLVPHQQQHFQPPQYPPQHGYGQAYYQSGPAYPPQGPPAGRWEAPPFRQQTDAYSQPPPGQQYGYGSQTQGYGAPYLGLDQDYGLELQLVENRRTLAVHLHNGTINRETYRRGVAIINEEIMAIQQRRRT